MSLSRKAKKMGNTKFMIVVILQSNHGEYYLAVITFPEGAFKVLEMF